jgi:hypothetical protein
MQGFDGDHREVFCQIYGIDGCSHKKAVDGGTAGKKESLSLAEILSSHQALAPGRETIGDRDFVGQETSAAEYFHTITP